MEGGKHVGVVHLVEEVEDDGAGSHSESDHIGQRVKLLADRRRHAEGPRHHAVEEIEHGSEDNHQHRPLVVPVESGARRHTSANQIAARQGIGNVNQIHNRES